MSISDRLDEIEARANVATEGPWSFVADTRFTDMTRVWRIGSTGASADVACTPRFGDDSDDAEFIAASRTDVPAMLAALRAVLDLHQPRESCCDDCGPQQCEECEAWEWPCQTFRAIATALGEGQS